MEEDGRSSQFFTGWQRPLHSLQNNRLTLNMLNLEASKLYYAAFTKSNCHNIKFAFVDFFLARELPETIVTKIITHCLYFYSYLIDAIFIEN